MEPVSDIADVPVLDNAPKAAVIPVGNPLAARVMPLVVTPPTPFTVTVPAAAAIAAETTDNVDELMEA